MTDRFEFTPEHDGTLTIESCVYQALGAASMCWSETPRGIFQSDRAREIGEALLDKLGRNDLVAS